MRAIVVHYELPVIGIVDQGQTLTRHRLGTAPQPRLAHVQATDVEEPRLNPPARQQRLRLAVLVNDNEEIGHGRGELVENLPVPFSNFAIRVYSRRDKLVRFLYLHLIKAPATGHEVSVDKVVLVIRDRGIPLLPVDGNHLFRSYRYRPVR
ncbi:hypothetical protein [Butyricimonas virosa]|uniref:hypothetical protein n=1 Tax=Butyricimonas virosa TaxID=544645 RepID=UPI00307C1482